MGVGIQGKSGRVSVAILLAFACFVLGAAGEAGADQAALSRAIAGVVKTSGWILSAERVGGPEDGAFVVAFVGQDGGVSRVRIEDGVASPPEPFGGDKARSYAADVLQRAGKAPDLAALARRVEGMAQGCRVDEVEVELHGDNAVAEVECTRGSIEVELVFDIRDGQLMGLEVEDEEDDDDEDEDEDEGELELDDEDDEDGE